MTALFMRSEATGAEWRVWPGSEPLPTGAVQENRSYLFELNGDAGADDAGLLIDDVPLEALRVSTAGTACWRWSPGFHAGTVEGELRVPGHAPRHFTIVTDPDLQKLTRDEFDVMVREILEDTFTLFSLSGFRTAIARGTGGRAPAIARLEFVRSRIDELESIVDQIARNPRRRLTAEDQILPYHRAGHATGPEVLRSFRSGRIAQESGAAKRLPASLKGFLPERIRVRSRRSALDLQEHRQMAACLRFWAAWLHTVAGLLERAQVRGDGVIRRSAGRWALRSRQMARRVGLLATAAPFAEAGDAAPRLVLSALFRHQPAYRRFYRVWRDMNLGIAAVFGDFLNLPLARTFELYELWCFLRLVRAAAETFGAAGLDVRDLFITDAAGGLTLAAGPLIVPVGGGWRVYFQRQFREYWIEPDGRGSYSRVMTPDLVLAREAAQSGSGCLIVLDAKYRIDDGLSQALGSIHMYRDALVEQKESGGLEGLVSAAYLLTPHRPAQTSDYQTTPMPDRLFHAQYRAGFHFGALTFRPGMTLAEITGVFRTAVADATGGTAR
jgi:hypothetical protein